MLKIYLDNCCYNRPFDISKEPWVLAETKAKLFIQSLVKYGDIRLVSSFVLYAEAAENPSVYKRDAILQFIDQYAKEYISSESKSDVLIIADEIMQTGIKAFDAAHIACALLAKCDYFITTDKRILKYQTKRLQLVNPVSFIEKWENIQ